MPQETPPPIDEIRALVEQCQTMIEETEKQDTLLNHARRYEFRNLKANLMMLLQSLILLSVSETREIFQNIRQRIRNLINDPESAGNHDHMLQKGEPAD